MFKRDQVFNDLMKRYPDMSWEDLHASKFVLQVRSGPYWRPDSCGYGPLQEAGLYSFDFACSVVSNHRDAGDRMIPIQKLKDELIEMLHGAARLLVAVRENERA